MTDSRRMSGDVIRAGEYILQLLDAEDRQVFEDRLNAEPGLRRLVQELRVLLADLVADEAAAMSPARLRAELIARIGPEPERPRMPGWLWGFGAGFVAMVVITAIMTFSLLQGPQQLTPSYQAELISDGGGLAIVAGYVPEEQTILVSRREGGAQPGRALELWLFPEGSETAVSLGVLPKETEARILVPQDLARLVPTGRLAISDEPKGGSPGGQATGDLLAAAEMREF